MNYLNIKYSKEYQEYVKNITDIYISMLTGTIPLEFDIEVYKKLASMSDDEQKAFIYKNNNAIALKWLNENMISYEKFNSKEIIKKQVIKILK